PGAPPPVAPPPVPSPVISHFNKLEYHNFLKLGKAVKCTAEGLTEFADDVVKHFHTSLLHQHGSAVCTSPGSQKRITFDRRSNSWSINCPCAVCGPWTRSIGAEQATRQICWQNTSVDDWPVDAWQLAKPFMSEGKATSCNSPTDTDPAGILQLLINCKKYGPLLDIQKVKAVRDIRNACMHSSDFSVTTPDMKAHIQAMITLLLEPRVWAYQCAKDAVDDLRQIELLDLAVNDDKVLQYERITWGQKLTALDQQHKALDQQHKALDQQHKAVDQKQQALDQQQQALGQKQQALGQQQQVLDQQQQALGQKHQVLDQQQQALGHHQSSTTQE
ncbi:hypothetical protein LSAT2_019317, partial [Lamellibrachia satsuma]